MTTANNMIEQFMAEIKALAFHTDFIKTSAELAGKLGITATEWNSNKAAILMMFAKEIWSDKVKYNQIATSIGIAEIA